MKARWFTLPVVTWGLVVSLCLSAQLQAKNRQAEADRLPALLAKVAVYEYGSSREALEELSGYVGDRLSDRKQMASIEKAFVQFLDSRASLAGKDFICRQLAVFATETSTPVLERLIRDPQTCEMARSVLEKIPGKRADEALRNALRTAGTPHVVGIINSIGMRRDRKATRLLIPFLSSEETFEAAANALARIGDQEAISALLSAKTTADSRKRSTVQEALMNWADLCVREGRIRAAYIIYRDMIFASEPAQIRIAGLHGLWRAMGNGAIPTLLSALKEGDEEVGTAALRLLVESPLPDVTRQLMRIYPTLAPIMKVRMLAALADRRDRAAAAFVKEVAASGPDQVRAAALEALARLGDASCVTLLSTAAADSSGVIQQAARNTLYRIPGQDVDQSILNAIPTASGPVKVELLRAVAERGIREASPVLVEAIRDTAPEVRREALRAWREIGREKDVAPLLAFLTTTPDRGEREEAARAVSAACRRSGGAGMNLVVAAYSSVTRPEVRESLVTVLATGGSREGLPLLKAALKEDDPAVCRAAILALGDWTDSEPLPELAAAARETSLPAHHVLALRSYLKLLQLPSDRPERESVRLLADALEIARAPEVKKAALAVLPRFVCQEAIDLAQSVVGDPDVQAEAEQAIGRLKQAMAYR
ncbi:MAG TPA: HEAT repeat domain-containing protein [Acidobacteriota bacterium]|nr:HEAT repeat domain-containing protein [Acidobacteriota bacterium]